MNIDLSCSPSSWERANDYLLITTSEKIYRLSDNTRSIRVRLNSFINRKMNLFITGEIAVGTFLARPEHRAGLALHHENPEVFDPTTFTAHAPRQAWQKEVSYDTIHP
jgi:hypothetical protein